MTKPTLISSPGPRFQYGLGPPSAGGGAYDNSTTGIPGDPATYQAAIDALVGLLREGYPRPLMAEDAGNPGYWYVVVDGDGNAVMVTV